MKISTAQTHNTHSSLRQLSRAMVRQLGMLNAVCGDLPLSPVQAHTLLELGQQSLSIKQIAQLLNVDKSNASRAVSHLVSKKLAITQVHPKDNRSLVATLTPQGKKLLAQLDEQQIKFFNNILAQLSPAESHNIELAIGQYNKAILKAKRQQDFIIRDITPFDDSAIAAVIRQVSTEYGLTPDKGYGVADPTLDTLSQVYQAENAHYWVIEYQGQILGGGGIAPLAGANNHGVCELQKMYFLPELRGKGLARRLAYQALDFAREQGYSSCYLETTACLKEAILLYESMGFEHIQQHLGATGHDACELPMLMALK